MILADLRIPGKPSQYGHSHLEHRQGESMVRLLRESLLPLRFLASCLFLAQFMVANGFSQITPALLSPLKMLPSVVSKQLLSSPVKLSLPDVAVKQNSAGPE